MIAKAHAKSRAAFFLFLSFISFSLVQSKRELLIRTLTRADDFVQGMTGVFRQRIKVSFIT